VKSNILLFTLTAVLLTWGTVGCFFHSDDTSAEFFKKPIASQLKEFPNYDLETQYTLYIYGCQVREPPAIYLAEVFAGGGQPSAALLSRKLAQANDDLTIRDIVQVFYWMNRLRDYDLRDDVTLQELMRQKVSSMTEPDWKRMAQEDLLEENGSGGPSRKRPWP